MAQKKADLRAEVTDAVLKRTIESDILGHNVEVYCGGKGFIGGTVHSLDYDGYVVITGCFSGRHKVGSDKETGEYTRTVLIPKDRVRRIQATKGELASVPGDDDLDTEGVTEIKS